MLSSAYINNLIRDESIPHSSYKSPPFFIFFFFNTQQTSIFIICYGTYKLCSILKIPYLLVMKPLMVHDTKYWYVCTLYLYEVYQQCLHRTTNMRSLPLLKRNMMFVILWWISIHITVKEKIAVSRVKRLVVVHILYSKANIIIFLVSRHPESDQEQGVRVGGYYYQQQKFQQASTTSQPTSSYSDV